MWAPNDVQGHVVFCEEPGERNVPEAASFRPWNRTVEGAKSAATGVMDDGGSVASGICLLFAWLLGATTSLEVRSSQQASMQEP